MNSSNCARQRHGGSKELCDFRRLTDVTSNGQTPGRPREIEFGRERVFVLEPPDTLRRRLFCRECDRKDWRGVIVLSAAVKGKVRAFPQGHQYVPRGTRDG